MAAPVFQSLTKPQSLPDDGQNRQAKAAKKSYNRPWKHFRLP